MTRPLSIVGAPSSAGAYAPGQEKAPAALRAVGLIDHIQASGVKVVDRGDVAGFRWRADKANPRAMNVAAAAKVARDVAKHVAAALAGSSPVLVLGGDCTVELGTVAGALAETDNVGLVYVDLDTDLNTPASTTDGALDWMGVAHMLGVDGVVPALATLGPRTPMLRPEQVLFGHDNVTPPERRIMDTLGIAEAGIATVAADPTGAARFVIDGWARQFERLLVHLDVDVLDYLDMPLAENTRRNVGLRFDQLVPALGVLLSASNWAALTICEVNPDHGEADGSTLRIFAEAVADALAGSPRLNER